MLCCKYTSIVLTKLYHFCSSTLFLTSAHNTLLGHFTVDRYSCFDVRKDEGKRLVEVLQDLMNYEDDELRVCSAKLLFDIYKVSAIIV